MIAIDTNVLLRYLLQDDLDQSAKSERLIRGNSQVLVTDIVLVEALWTLKGKKYKATKEDMLKALTRLFEEPSITFEDSSTVWRAMHDFRLSRADFPDALIVRKSSYVANLRGEQLDATYTFDQGALTLDGTKPA